MTRWFDPALQNLVIGDANTTFDGSETTLISQGGSVRELNLSDLPGSSSNLLFGSGVPSNSSGSNGDFYFRSDGARATDTLIYHKESGVWLELITAGAYYNTP
jgi:hypothetical protein